MKSQVLKKMPLFHFSNNVLWEATQYVLDLFKVLQGDWMAASLITFYNLCFMREIRVDWGANQMWNIEKVTAVLILQAAHARNGY